MLRLNLSWHHCSCHLRPPALSGNCTPAPETPTHGADLYDKAIASQPRAVCLSYTADGFVYDHVPDEPSDTELFFSSAATHHDMIERSQADDFVAYHASTVTEPTATAR